MIYGSIECNRPGVVVCGCATAWESLSPGEKRCLRKHPSAKSADGCNRGGRVHDRGFIPESDRSAIRRGASLLTIGGGSSAQMRHRSTKLTVFENLPMCFWRSLAFDTRLRSFETKPGP
jgi:hypothetical protein